MSVGKVITLFLVDGIPDGRLLGEIFNWTGKALKIPRKLLKESSDREELTKAGVYFLFGKDENNPEDNAVYIGEAEETYKRLIQHQKLEFWNEVIVFSSKDENLNKAHIKYLESKLFENAKETKRYNLINSTTPTCPSLSEADQAVMTEYIENFKILINTLGYKLFEPLANILEKQKNYYSIKAARGANAKAVVTNEGVVVMQGSEMATSVVSSMQSSLINIRDKLVKQGIVVEENSKLLFVQDYLFSSPSTAAAVVMGRNANGRKEWKDKKGNTIADNEEQSK